VRRIPLGLLLIAAGCGARAQSGPAWPKSAGAAYVEPEREDAKDGGESLEPKVPASVASVEASAPDEPSPADKAPATDATKPVTPDKPATDAAATPPAPTDPPVVDEITIEVHGDGP